MSNYFCNECAVDGGGHALECPKRERALRAAKLDEIAAMSQELDAASDKLNHRIVAFENDLEDAEVRVWLWLDELFTIDDAEYRLGYQRTNNGARVVAARRIKQGEPPLFDTMQPLGDSARVVRVALVPHLDKLLDALLARVEMILGEVQALVGEEGT